MVTATRFWARSEHDVDRLKAFLNRACKYSSTIIVAINKDADTQDTVNRICNSFLLPKVEIIPISPWGGVTHALNLLLQHTISKYPQVPYILFQSPEVLASQQDIVTLSNWLRDEANDVLVVGRALPGHPMYGFRTEMGKVKTTVEAIPWNTLAVWDVRKLGQIGFPLLADRVNPPGMEEVAAIAVQQRIYGALKRKALLVCDEGVEWENNFEGTRAEAHANKMESKIIRAELILDGLGVRKEGELKVSLVSDVQLMLEVEEGDGGVLDL